MISFPPLAVLLDFFLWDFRLNENTQFWSGHGWMTVLIVAWLAPLVVIPRRLLGWLTLLCTLRQLIVAREYLYTSLANSPYTVIEPTAWLSRLLGIACAWVLWELAVTLPDRGGVSPVRRWLGRAVWLLLLIGGIVGGLDWAGVIEAFALAPTSVLLAFAFWRHGPAEERPGMRMIGVGFALLGCGTTLATLTAAWGAPGWEALLYLAHLSGWVVSAGIGWAVLRHYRTFSRLACITFLTLTALPIWAGLAFGVFVPITAARTQRDLLDRGEALAATVPIDAVVRLTSDTPEPGDRAAIEAALQPGLASSAFLRRAYLWHPENGRRRVFAGLVPGRPWTIRSDRPAYWYNLPDQKAMAAGQRLFETPYEAHDGELVDLTLPLRRESGGPVIAWITIESNSRPYWRALSSIVVPLMVLFDCFAPYLNALAILAWRRATEQRRIEQLIRVQQSDRAKTEFLAFLGHELRTPLQTILGRAEMLRPEPAAARHAAAIEAQGRLLLRLVNDLLDLGTIEAGHFTLRAQPFSLRASLTHLEDLVAPLAAAKGLNLNLSLATDVPDSVLGDEPRLRQILGNLLANAVKYTNRGEVRLDVTVADDGQPGLIFRVRDTGPGLPAEKIPQLFTLFTRLDAGDTFTREGTGVGLALVKRLCDLMGGQVTAANRSTGGAEFVVRLPFAATDLPVAAPIPASQPIAPTQLLHVLIAEDNTAARELLSEAVRQLGHSVTTAADGPTALAACARETFDAVVLDVNLPGVDGIEIARRLRARPQCPRLIGCSAEVIPATRQAALDAGMSAFLEKPVALSRLAAELASPIAGNVFDSVRTGTSADKIRGIIRTEIPGLQRQLAAALDARDAAALRRLAHYMHTSALLLNASELVALCSQLSRQAEAGDYQAASTTVTQLDSALTRIVS